MSVQHAPQAPPAIRLCKLFCIALQCVKWWSDAFKRDVHIELLVNGLCMIHVSCIHPFLSRICVPPTHSLVKWRFVSLKQLGSVASCVECYISRRDETTDVTQPSSDIWTCNRTTNGSSSLSRSVVASICGPVRLPTNRLDYCRYHISAIHCY